jgi:hypothetical protein
MDLPFERLLYVFNRVKVRRIGGLINRCNTMLLELAS